MSDTTTETTSNDTKYQSAQKRVKELKEYYSHVMIFVIVNLGLFLLNILTSPNYLWFYWSLFGWGIGLAAHTMSTFGIDGMFGKDWEERKINELMNRNKKG